MAEALAERVGGEVVFDPDPLGYPSPWRTYRHALTLTPENASHRVVIQDDAHVCVNFTEALEHVVAARPDSPIVLFVAGHPKEHVRVLMRACDRDEPFAVLPPDQWVPAVAVIWPVGVIRPILDWVDEQDYPVQFRADDEILGRATRALSIPILCTVPSLVEHPDITPSIMGKYRSKAGEDPNRVAACFIDGDPLDIDWH